MMKDDKNNTPSTLQDQAWKRAKDNVKPKTGYPWDWLDYEEMEKELEEKEKDE